MPRPRFHYIPSYGSHQATAIDLNVPGILDAIAKYQYLKTSLAQRKATDQAISTLSSSPESFGLTPNQAKMLPILARINPQAVSQNLISTLLPGFQERKYADEQKAAREKQSRSEEAGNVAALLTDKNYMAGISKEALPEATTAMRQRVGQLDSSLLKAVTPGEPEAPQITSNVIPNKDSSTGYSYADKNGQPIAEAPAPKSKEGETKWGGGLTPSQWNDDFYRALGAQFGTLTDQGYVIDPGRMAEFQRALTLAPQYHQFDPNEAAVKVSEIAGGAKVRTPSETTKEISKLGRESTNIDPQTGVKTITSPDGTVKTLRPKRTGTYEGKKVIQYEDGSIEYAP